MGVLDFLNPRKRRASALAKQLVRRGLGTLEEVAGEVELAAEVSPADAKALVEEAWSSLGARASAGTMSLERLDACFAALESAGVLARHYPEARRTISRTASSPRRCTEVLRSEASPSTTGTRWR